jgi:hypothetical protein
MGPQCPPIINIVCAEISSQLQAQLQDISEEKKNSVALVRERTIPTERPPPVGEVSANFCG